LLSNALKLKKFNQLNIPSELFDLLKVGVHKDVEVTAKDWGNVLLNDPKHTVT